MDLDEDDERAIGVLHNLNAGPVTTAAAVAAPGDGGRGLAAPGAGARAVRVYSRQYQRRMYTCIYGFYRCCISPYSPYTRTMALQLCAVSRSLEMCIEIRLRLEFRPVNCLATQLNNSSSKTHSLACSR